MKKKEKKMEKPTKKSGKKLSTKNGITPDKAKRRSK